MKRKIYSYLIVLFAGLVVLQYQACGRFTPSEGLVMGSSKSPSTFRDEQLEAEADEDAIAFLDSVIDGASSLLSVSSLDIAQKSTSNSNFQTISLNDSSPLANNLFLEDSKKGSFPVSTLNTFGTLPSIEFGTSQDNETLVAQKSITATELSLLLVVQDMLGGDLLELKNNLRSIKLIVNEGNLIVVSSESGVESARVSASIESLEGGKILALQMSTEGVVSIRSENTQATTLEGGTILLGQEPLQLTIGRNAKFKLGSLLLVNQVQSENDLARLIRGLKLTWLKSN